MIKNFKSLFVKTEGEEEEVQAPETENLSFPVSNTSPGSAPASSSPNSSDPVTQEVIKVYESGLESINMPGFDFYEFYQSVSVTGNPGEQAYTMAFQMAKSLDKTISPQKLIQDAEFYISKINEVHSQYVNQGQQKLHTLEEKKSAEKKTLNSEIDKGLARISQLKAELHQLESDINTKRNVLSKIEDNYYPQEKQIKEKLSANDYARKMSIDKLNRIKDGILKYIKG